MSSSQDDVPVTRGIHNINYLLAQFPLVCGKNVRIPFKRRDLCQSGKTIPFAMPEFPKCSLWVTSIGGEAKRATLLVPIWASICTSHTVPSGTNLPKPARSLAWPSKFCRSTSFWLFSQMTMLTIWSHSLCDDRMTIWSCWWCNVTWKVIEGGVSRR